MMMMMMNEADVVSSGWQCVAKRNERMTVEDVRRCAVLSFSFLLFDKLFVNAVRRNAPIVLRAQSCITFALQMSLVSSPSLSTEKKRRDCYSLDRGHSTIRVDELRHRQSPNCIYSEGSSSMLLERQRQIVLSKNY